MRRMNRWITAFLVMLVVAFTMPTEAFAKRSGFSSGGRSSFKSTRSTPRTTVKSTPKSTTRTKSKAVTQKRGATTTEKSKATKPAVTKQSKTDKKALERAKANGTAFNSKSEATASFKSKYGSQYTSKYASKPATRPSHIPQSTTVGGNTYNVTYNQSMGGYGYMNAMGTWMMYDAMTDAIMLNALMAQNNYHYTGMTSAGGTTVVHTRANSGWTILWIILGVVVFAAFIRAVVD